jgi:hypothetical protein
MEVAMNEVEIRIIEPILNDKILKTLAYMGSIIYEKLKEEKSFTGKIDFTIHCKDGGIGNIEAFSKNKINKK